LYGLACAGQAPSFLRKCTKEGLPIWCVFITCKI
jgi:amino acid transporter